MRLLLVLVLVMSTYALQAQSKGEPFYEARRAIKALEDEPYIKDSLRSIYAKKWTLGLVLGKRYISGNYQSNEPDTVTFADFSETNTYLGFELGYFLSDRIRLHFALDGMLLPVEEEFGTIMFGGPDGISVEGRGSGGALINLGVGMQYYLAKKSATRPFVGLQVGVVIAVAKGGTGGFTLSRGRFEDLRTDTERFGAAELSLGLSHRFTPVFITQCKVAYRQTNLADEIGGIESPGGPSISLQLQFVLKGNQK